jgi:hypothetical protein
VTPPGEAGVPNEPVFLLLPAKSGLDGLYRLPPVRELSPIMMMMMIELNKSNWFDWKRQRTEAVEKEGGEEVVVVERKKWLQR